MMASAFSVWASVVCLPSCSSWPDRIETNRETDRPIDRQKQRQADRRRERQRESERERERETDRETETDRERRGAIKKHEKLFFRDGLGRPT